MTETAETILNITGEKVALGPMRREHLELALNWINDFDTIRTMGAPPRPMTLEAEVEWYENMRKSDSDVVFTIYEREELRPVGSAGLHRIDWRHRTAEYGILIGSSGDRGKGLGTETTRLILEYAFRQLGLSNVMLRAVEINEAGIRAYQTAGFKEFGRRRKAWFVEGTWYDIVYMDCVEGDVAAR